MRLFYYGFFVIVVMALILSFMWFFNENRNNDIRQNSVEQNITTKDNDPIVGLLPQPDMVEQRNTPQDEETSKIVLPPPVIPVDERLKKQFCSTDSFEYKTYVVCRANPSLDRIELFLNGADGKPYKRFYRLENALNAENKTIAFAMNAGMYHADYTAVGLYVENGKELHSISTKDGPGNFHMKPNGVFFINNGKAGILDTDSFIARGLKPQLATQSGPMLVINNEIHHRFIPQSPYLEYRNGVGVTNDGEVIFIISEQKVNFDEMARFFRDKLKTPNALFFDGSISSLYSPELSRKDWWHGLGPIIAVTLDKND
ncbi:phosphodiester glycosidase family protein [Bartonella sp. HY329]|uniref:phosphodiester glycosidase family protein n=1 Tax=unclassified Bartonella TaxID=2645622 RepID=UPI0021C8C8C9|nr:MULTISPECIES: phosphodiester glycosidase family protein [unclassified Bartonella]UXM94192.1 phosphodiester glycosidase family protein [Bartonella sp. HY329]UXN08514.1 phosphodiester glycosidase family protein [Bartonella sp. HY328]